MLLRPLLATDLTRPAEMARPRFVRPTVSQRVGGASHEATVELVFLEAPREERPTSACVGLASVGWLGITNTGAG